jgi:hypothetical protein
MANGTPTCTRPARATTDRFMPLNGIDNGRVKRNTPDTKTVTSENKDHRTRPGQPRSADRSRIKSRAHPHKGSAHGALVAGQLPRASRTTVDYRNASSAAATTRKSASSW